MSLAQWDESLATGHYAVDRQHQELFDLFQALHDAIIAKSGKPLLQETLDGLARYVVHHFSAEEKLMQDSGYPETARHMAEHRKLTAHTAKIISDYRDGRLTLSVTLCRFLVTWLFHHIREVDQRMIAHVRASACSRDVAGRDLA